MEDEPNCMYEYRFRRLCELMRKEREENHLNFPQRLPGMYIAGIRYETDDVIFSDWEGHPRVLKVPKT